MARVQTSITALAQPWQCVEPDGVVFSCLPLAGSGRPWRASARYYSTMIMPLFYIWREKASSAPLLLFHLVETNWNEIFVRISFGWNGNPIAKDMFGCHMDFWSEIIYISCLHAILAWMDKSFKKELYNRLTSCFYTCKDHFLSWSCVQACTWLEPYTYLSFRELIN